jgi:hypothetical protein
MRPVATCITTDHAVGAAPSNIGAVKPRLTVERFRITPVQRKSAAETKVHRGQSHTIRTGPGAGKHWRREIAICCGFMPLSAVASHEDGGRSKSLYTAPEGKKSPSSAPCCDHLHGRILYSGNAQT